VTLGAATVALVLAATGGATHLGSLQLEHVNNTDGETDFDCDYHGACLRAVNSEAATGDVLLAWAQGGGNGVEAISNSGAGAYGISNLGDGVAGESHSQTASGIYGTNDSGGYGVTGRVRGDHATGPNVALFGEVSWPFPMPNAAAVRGANTATNGNGSGVFGSHTGSGIGVLGTAASGVGVAGTTTNQNGIAIVGYRPNGSAGLFVGNVHVQGTLSKSAGSFRIDHPLDPAHKYLQHSFIESPDMKNVYDGVITTDRRGFATVRLPRYFQALNRSFRYQLTLMGKAAWGAQAVVWKEIRGSRFVVRSKPHVKVSWQVTGIRKDRYANAHRIQPELAKPASEQGTYLAPELHGKSGSQASFRLPNRKD
jgi:hypothetical protein